MNEIRIENFLYPYVRFFNASPNLQNADFYIGNSLAAAYPRNLCLPFSTRSFNFTFLAINLK